MPFSMAFTFHIFEGNFHVSVALPFLWTSDLFFLSLRGQSLLPMGIPWGSQAACLTAPPSQWQFNNNDVLYPAGQISCESVKSVPIYGTVAGIPA